MSVDTEAMKQEIQKAASREKLPTVFELIERTKPQLARYFAGDDAMAERVARVAMTELRRTPKLMECDPHSLLGALMLSAQLALEPGPLGHVYLIPFGREVTFIVGYRGMIELAHRSGQVKDVHAGLVHEGDTFRYRYGTRPELIHEPDGPAGQREIVAAYAVARLRSGGAPFVVTYEEDWERARKASAAGSKDRGPWKDDRPAMIRKTAVRRLQPYIPQTAAWATAVERDELPAPADVELIDGDTLAGELAASVAPTPGPGDERG